MWVKVFIVLGLEIKVSNMDPYSLAAILGVAICGVIMGVFYVKNRLYDPETIKGRMQIRDRYIKELENDIDSYAKENKRLKGRINSAKGSVGISDQIDMDSPEGVAAGIKELLPQIAPYLPKSAQSLLNDPKIIDIALEFYKKDPEKAQQILSNFIKKGGRSKSSSSGSSSGGADEIPDFRPNEAI